MNHELMEARKMEQIETIQQSIKADIKKKKIQAKKKGPIRSTEKLY